MFDKFLWLIYGIIDISGFQYSVGFQGEMFLQIMVHICWLSA